MPRLGDSRATQIVKFFRVEPLEVAETVFDLCRDAIRERKANGPVPTPVKMVARKKPGPVKGSKRAVKAGKLGTTPINEAIPLGQ